MYKPNVCILDTGLDLGGCIDVSRITLEKFIQLEDFEKITDENGHGTLCINTLLRECKNVNIFPVKCFDSTGLSSVKNIIHLMHKIYEYNFDVINISASICKTNYEKEFEYICEKISEKGTIIVSSQMNGVTEESIPFKFKSVLGVEGSKIIKEDYDHIFHSKCNKYIGFDGYKLIEGRSGKLEVFGRNSRAAIIATSKIVKYLTYSKLLDRKLKLENVFNIKKQESIKYDFKTDYQKNNRILKDITTIINSNFSEELIKKKIICNYGIMNNLTGVGLENIHIFLQKLIEENQIKVDIRDINISKLNDLDYLFNLFI